MNTSQMFKILAEVTGQGRILTVPRLFVERTGSHTAAILLSQALYWQTTQADEQGWIKKSDADVEKELLIKRDQLVEIREILKAFGLLHARRGLPASTHYKLDIDQFFKAFGAVDTVSDSATAQKSPSQTRSGFSPELDRGFPPNLEARNNVQDAVEPPLSLISINTLEKKGGVSTGDLVGGQTGMLDPSQQQRKLILDTMAINDQVLNALPAETRIRLVEVQRISKRSETVFRAWVRDFVFPQMERLGKNFPGAVDEACKAAVLANPSYCLSDFVKSITAAQPPAGGRKTLARGSQASLDPLQEFLEAVLEDE